MQSKLSTVHCQLCLLWLLSICFIYLAKADLIPRNEVAQDLELCEQSFTALGVLSKLVPATCCLRMDGAKSV